MFPRDRQPERMDDPHLAPVEHRRALLGLARINKLTRSAQLFLPIIKELQAEVAPKPLRILDVATGSGDIPAALQQLVGRHAFPIQLSACDISPLAIEEARAAAPGVNFFVHDVLKDPLPGEYDLVICSLFLHHLEHAQQLHLLREMARVSVRGIALSDLVRSRLNYWLVWIAARLASRSHIVHEDGPLSVRAALTISEMQALALEAGLNNSTVKSCFPSRFLMIWKKLA